MQAALLFSWGSCATGQLGLPMCCLPLLPLDCDGFPYSSRPVLQPCLLTGVSCGDDFSIAVDSHSTVFAWGSNACGQLGLAGDLLLDSQGYPFQPVPRGVEALQDVKVTMVACGSAHTVVLAASGAVYSWGSAGYGELGHPDIDKFPTDDEGLPYLPVPTVVAGLSSDFVKYVACGKSHSAAITVEGTLFLWGAAESGQLARSDFNKLERNQDGDLCAFTPQVSPAFAGKRVKQVACGGRHTVVLAAKGTVFSCGSGVFGQLGLGHPQSLPRDTFGNPFMPLPRVVLGLTDVQVVSVACGDSHSIALAQTGEVFAWGAAACGQLGLLALDTLPVDSEYAPFAPMPMPVLAVKEKCIVAAACGETHTLLLTREGTVYSCGSNYHHQLGTAGRKETVQSAPMAVKEFSDRRVTAVAAGTTHSMALVATDRGTAEDLYWLFQTQQMCDMAVVCEGGEDRLECHKCVVAGKSDFLEKCLRAGTVVSVKCSPAVLSEFLDFCYLGDIETTEAALAGETDENVTDMMALAECRTESSLAAVCRAQIELRLKMAIQKMAIADGL